MADAIQTALNAIFQATIGWVAGFQYQPLPGQECPGCHHQPRMQRHVGFIIGGHTQQSCPCRLVRQNSDPNFACRCEWTQDI